VKLLIPIFFFLIIFGAFIVNLNMADSYGNTMCKAIQDSITLQAPAKQLSEYSVMNNADPEIVYQMHDSLNHQEAAIQQDYYSIRQNLLSPLVIGNTLFFYSRVYVIYPFVTAPCEYANSGSNDPNAASCEYFISKENWDCIQTQANGMSADTAVGPDYREVNIASYVANALIFLILLYLFVCLVIWLGELIIRKPSIFWMLLTIICMAITLYLSILNYMSDFSGFPAFSAQVLMPYIFLIFLLIFMSYIERFVGKVWIRIMLASFIIICAACIIVAGYMIHMQAQPMTASSSVEPRIVYCNSTGELTGLDAINFLHIPLKNASSYVNATTGELVRYVNETVNVCMNPGCRDICHGLSNESVELYSLRGDSPSCVCAVLVHQAQ
jgi:hypothetical protein